MIRNIGTSVNLLLFLFLKYERSLWAAAGLIATVFEFVLESLKNPLKVLEFQSSQALGILLL